MKVPCTGAERGAPPPEGGPNSSPRTSPELIENSFSDKSAMAKRLELVLGPGGFDFHSFPTRSNTSKHIDNQCCCEVGVVEEWWVGM